MKKTKLLRVAMASLAVALVLTLVKGVENKKVAGIDPPLPPEKVITTVATIDPPLPPEGNTATQQ